MHHLIEVWFHWVQTGGYGAVFWLMALESTVVPIPSEVVIPPAAIVAATQQDSGMSLTGVVIAGTLGSWFGSAVMYVMARWLGRALVLRYGKYFLVPPDKFARAEIFMRRYEAGGIFFARLLPVIRHLISIPAGIIRMGFVKFSILTLVGAGVWCTVLAWLGGRVGAKLTPAQLQDADAIIHATKSESFPIIAAVLLVCALYILAMKLTAPKSVAAESSAG
ncbi:MAG TPA: DedA family protein [Chthoniobacterales bacterium]|nr:DedA family protein [Chthoniobacterales bacterium]